MQLSRSISPTLLSIGLLASACGTEHRKIKTPEPQPELPINPIEPKCQPGQVIDTGTNSCRQPTERECLERNTVKSSTTCDTYFPSLGSDTVNAPKIDLASFCEKNTAGALINCKDGVYSLPVTAIAHVEGTPEAFLTMPVDQEIKLQHAIKATGDVNVTVEVGGETVDLLRPNDSTVPWLLRNLKVGDSIPLNVSFAADMIINSRSEIRISDQLSTYHDKAQILAAIAGKTVANQWLSLETSRQSRARIYKSNLNGEWLLFLKDAVKGDVVWSMKDDCPAEHLKTSLGTWFCQVDQDIKSKPTWKNQAFVNTCQTARNNITLNYAQERYGVLNYGRFHNEEFSIFIPKNTLVIGPACFIKIVE